MSCKHTVLQLCLCLLIGAAALAQTPTPPDGGPGPQGQPPNPGMTKKKQYLMQNKQEMGAWWKNSDTVQQLGLSDSQVKQIESTFLEHKLRLIDANAEVQKAETRFKEVMDSDNPADPQLNPLLDKLISARGNLEREYTGMLLSVRRVLTPDQWKKLRTIQAEHMPGPPGPGMFKQPGPGGPPRGDGFMGGPGQPGPDGPNQGIPLPPQGQQ